MIKSKILIGLSYIFSNKIDILINNPIAELYISINYNHLYYSDLTFCPLKTIHNKFKTTTIFKTIYSIK